MKKILSVAALAMMAFGASAQTFSADSLDKRFSVFTNWCSPEKLYLHIDRTYYTSDETIWFMGYLKDASGNSKQALSNYIYVELLDDKGEALRRVKVKRTPEGFPGCFPLPEEIKSGYYTLRAYTVWQMNADPEYMFNQRVKIIGTTPFKEPEVKIDTNAVDLSFYPEGGRYFAGARSTIGFKAMDASGRSAELKGMLYEEGGDAVCPVATIHDGMGKFMFMPKSGVNYYIQTSAGKKYPLPAASVDGATINLRYHDSEILATIAGPASGAKYSVVAMNADKAAVLADVAMDGKMHGLKLDKGMFMPGINRIMLVNADRKIVAERMFFVYDETTPVAALASRNNSPSPRGVISTTLSLKDASGAPVDGQCSIAIVRGSFKDHMQDDGIISYYQLSSELKGHINNPFYYFDSSKAEKERESSMDLLMMIQGWKYYDVEKIIDHTAGNFKISHLKEFWQNIKGIISNEASKKIPKNFIFSIIVPKLKLNKFVKVEQAKYFNLDSLDFPENTEFLISVTASGIGRQYAPRWSGDNLAKGYKYFPAPGELKSGKNKNEFELASDVVSVDTLKAAVVSANAAEDAFAAFSDGHTINSSDLETYKDFTLIEYITMKVPRFVYDGDSMYNNNTRVNTTFTDGEGLTEDEDGNNSGSLEGSAGNVKLILNETEEYWWTYEQVKLEDIEAINISTMPNSFYNATGGTVAIVLRPGAKVADEKTAQSLLYFIPLGYQKPKMFYSPRYDLGDARTEYDHRNTIYWSPVVKVKNGSASIDFCNTDQMDYPYIYRIEGITSDGRPFSTHSKLNFEL